jgi:hypothetical protein
MLEGGRELPLVFAEVIWIKSAIGLLIQSKAEARTDGAY